MARTTPAEVSEITEAPVAAALPVATSSARLSLLDRMKAHFAKEPRRRVKVRSQADVYVGINGYSFLIQPNVPVEVPESVAVLLEQADYI